MTAFKNGFRKLSLILMSVFVAVIIMPAFSYAAISVTPYTATVTSVDFGPGPVVLCTSLNGIVRYGQHDTSEIKPVTILQNFLNQHGYLSTTVTGYFGPLTFRAVKAFQAKNGLQADGIVGVQTEAHIRAVACPPSGTIVPVTPSMPSITAISPTAATTGTTVTVTGSGFTHTGNIVHFSIGGMSNIASTNNGTALSFTVPSSIGPYCKPDQVCALYMQLLNAGTYPVYVENANGVSNTVSFTITNNTTIIPR